VQRFAGYIRVSRVGARSKTLISPKLQEEAIRRSLIGREDIELEMLPPELDQSGGKDDRPILQGAIQRIKDGDLDGVVVWNFARFTRGGLGSSIRFLEAIEGVGGELHSASQPLDATTVSGRMQRNIYFSIAQAEREEMAEGFEKSKADAVARGVWTAPHVPFGFRKNEDRCLEHHPTEGPVRAEAVRRRAGGQPWGEIADYIAAQTGRSLTRSAVRAMVRSRLNLGEIRQGEHVNDEGVDPLVDRATFEAALLEQPKPPRGRYGEALLAKLVRCAGCSRTVSARVRNGVRFYECRRYHSAGHCPAPASANADLEEYVIEALLAHAREVAYNASDRTSAIEVAQQALEEAEAELTMYQETVRLSDIGAEHFEAGMRSRAASVEEARRTLAAARLAAPRVLPGTLEETWEQLTVAERRQVLRSSFSIVWLRGRSRDGRPLEERVRLIAAGHEPAGLSASGRYAGPLTGLAWDRDLEGEIRVTSMEDRSEAAGGAAL
jgi:site-specific DNA recombinase